jgi:FixJ family two-component response regulator
VLRRDALRKLEGYNNRQIAVELDTTERTVKRIRASWTTGANEAPEAGGLPDRRIRVEVMAPMSAEQSGDQAWIDAAADRFTPRLARPL